MSMKRIRLELARDHAFPEGSRERGYEFARRLTMMVTSLPMTGALRSNAVGSALLARGEGRVRAAGAPPRRQLDI
jgi:hypothetical protein